MANKDKDDYQPKFLYWPFPGAGYRPRESAEAPVPPRGGTGVRKAPTLKVPKRKS